MDTTEWQPLWGDCSIAVDNVHRFGEDALLLADFICPAIGQTVCDLGTGCGAVAWRLCAAGNPARVIGTDCSATAIALANRTAQRYMGAVIPTFFEADWNEPSSIAPAGSMDRVVCNPPYFSAGSGKQNQSEEIRLARHEQPSRGNRPDTLTAVCRAMAWLLKNGGKADLCHRPERLPAVLTALQNAGLEPKRLQPVAHTETGTPWLILIEAVKGGHPGLRWEPTVTACRNSNP